MRFHWDVHLHQGQLLSVRVEYFYRKVANLSKGFLAAEVQHEFYHGVLKMGIHR